MTTSETPREIEVEVEISAEFLRDQRALKRENDRRADESQRRRAARLGVTLDYD